MSISWVQSNESSNGGSTTINLAYVNPNVAGNLGVAYCFTSNGLNPSSLPDSNGNTWCQINFVQTNLGAVSAWVCASLLAGANTVTAVYAATPSSGTPTLHIHEYAYSGPAAIMSLQPEWYTPPISYFYITVLYLALAAGVIQNLNIAVMMATYDQGSAHGWNTLAPSVGRCGTMEASRASTISGDAIVNSVSQTPGFHFFCEFDNSDLTPQPYNNLICSFLIVSPAP